MAAQTTILVKSDDCTCILNWDDILLTAASCTMANVSGATDVTFFVTISGVTQFKTAPAGTSVVLTFTVPLAIINLGGVARLSNLNSIGCGVQVDTSVL